MTTNPSILIKEGLGTNLKELKKFIEIADLITTLSLEVTSNETSEMFEQAELFAGWADNINVKITIHGPNGELNNLKVINQLENKKYKSKCYRYDECTTMLSCSSSWCNLCVYFWW